MSKYGVFSGPYFPPFGLNTGKNGPEKNSVFGHFSHSVNQLTQSRSIEQGITLSFELRQKG